MATLDGVVLSVADRIRWVQAMMSIDPRRKGRKPWIETGQRSLPRQWDMWNARAAWIAALRKTNGDEKAAERIAPRAALAAWPGTSNHGKVINGVLQPSRAVDLGCDWRDNALRAEYFAKAGLHTPVKGEPWHAEEKPGAGPVPAMPKDKIQEVKEAAEMFGNPMVALVATPTGDGYYMALRDGAVLTFGDAQFYGSAGGEAVENAPFTDMAVHPSGEGYWLVGTDGGVFCFGASHFFGSIGDLKLAAPIRSITSTVTGLGYWLGAEDGGVFAFGDAQFYGAGIEHTK